MNTVTLKEHVGVNRFGRQVKFDQLIIVLDGQEVGYVGTFINAPINFCVRLSEQEKLTVVAEVSKQLNSTPRAISEPPAPASVPAEDLDDPLS